MRGKGMRIAQWVFGLLVVAFASIAIFKRWDMIRGRVATLHVEWLTLIEASLLVFIAFAVLIETWRRVLAAWDTKLPWWTAARIWFAASLGKYIPGNLWSLAALGVMARETGASSVAAAGSSIIVNVFNLVSGLVLVLIFASRLVPHAAVFAVVAIASVLGVLAAPMWLPAMVRFACRVTKRDMALPVIPASTVWWSLAGTTFAWCAYGLAFRLFAVALLGANAVHGAVVLFIAAYTAAYIVGFITLIAPAGIGVREAGIWEALPLLGLTTYGDAVIVAVISRLWLTVLEVIPGLVALAAGHLRPPTRSE
ncbi:MAG TPA: lysylphosphatidylglycerol synthase domain-containing protein [Gemmatimonadaceae bacterium]